MAVPLDNDVPVSTKRVQETVNTLTELRFGFVAIQCFDEAMAMRQAEDFLKGLLLSREMLGDPCLPTA